MVVAILAGAITITDAANNYNAAVAAFVAGVAAVAVITDAASNNNVDAADNNAAVAAVSVAATVDALLLFRLLRLLQ